MGMSIEEFANATLREVDNKRKGHSKVKRNELEAGIIAARLTATWIINYQGKVKADRKTPLTVKPTDLYRFDWEDAQVTKATPSKEEKEEIAKITTKWANPKNKKTVIRQGESIEDALNRLKDKT